MYMETILRRIHSLHKYCTEDEESSLINIFFYLPNLTLFESKLFAMLFTPETVAVLTFQLFFVCNRISY
jgi:hypothetical protein